MTRHPGGEAATLRLLSLSGIAPPCRVIDLGAGDGDAVRALRARGFGAVGIDLSPGVDVDLGDILAPPFPPGSFDAALSQCAFFLTGDVPAAFRAAYSLLRPGGVFMYSDIVPGGGEALRALAENAGFSLVSIEDTTPQWREYYIRALWQGAAEPPPKGADIRRSRYLSAIFRRP